MRLNKKSVVAVMGLALAGCGMFGKEKLQIDGDRISVLSEKKVIAADYTAGDIKIVLPKPLVNAAWPQSGGNAAHNIGHLKSSDHLQKAWSRQFGNGNSHRDYLIAAPVASHDTLFAIDADAMVSAFRQSDGKRLWKRRLKPQLRSDKNISLKGAGLAYRQETVYATTGFGGIFALDAKSGTVKWQYFAKTPIRIAPTVGGGKVFVQTIDNTLLALNEISGKEIWRYVAPSEKTTRVGGAVPAFSESADVLIAGFSNGELRALKASTGSPLWGDYLVSSRRTNSLDDINTIHANPVISGDIVFAVGNNNLLVAIDLRSGQRIWEREIGSTNQPWLIGKYLFLLANDACLMAIQADSGKIVWEAKIPAGSDETEQSGVNYSGPLPVNNRLLVNTSNGYTFYVSPYTGKILGHIENNNGSLLPPIAADGRVIITTSDAEIIVYQ